jgi:PAS domain S-box-containing protein
MVRIPDAVQQTPKRFLSEGRIEALRVRGGIFVEAVRVTRVPMLVTDPTLPGNPIVFTNDAFLALYGYQAKEVIGRDPHFMDGPRTRPASIDRFKAAIAAGRDETLDLLQYRRDGSTLWASVFVGRWRDEDGTVIHHFLSFLDITPRIEAEADLRALSATLESRVEERTVELEAANARLTELLAQRKVLLEEVNHRAKNSLMIASSLLSVQARRQQDEGVRIILQEAQHRLLTMARVHDLLSVSGDPQQVGLGGYLREICASLALTGDDARIRILVEVEAGIIISADRAVALGLIVNELVTNSVKHAFPPPAPGTITVRASRPAPDKVILTLRDDGIGMAPGGKANLGLGIVRSLVRKIGGEMQTDGSAGVSTTISFGV